MAERTGQSILGIPGASLYAWKNYFINSEIFGADIDRNILFSSDRIKTYYCDQTDRQAIMNMWNEPDLNQNFDVIIEDGLHMFEANVTFFENSIHKLKLGGLFIIEDINVRDIDRIRNKIKEWKEMYLNLRFRLELVFHSNQYDNNLLIVQKVIRESRTIVTGADSTYF
ncbi:MAG: hypothetical protein ACYCOU_08305 [Sulfobacillus sp.]